MKRLPVVLSDLLRNPAIAALNPGLVPHGRDISAVVAHETPKVSNKLKVRQSPQPKTRPEKEMALILEAQKRKGEISLWIFEGMTLQLGGCRYTSDFMVADCRENQFETRVRLIEVKGPYIRDDALVKWKMAKGTFTMFDFELWSLQKEGWTRIA